MKKVDSLINKLDAGQNAPGRQAQPATAADSPRHENEGASRHDLVDAINQMFAEFEMAYHNQFHKAFQGEGNVTLAKKFWLSNLSRFSPQVILRATRKLVSSQQYLPTLSAMVQACENSMTLFGLPACGDAYIEACQAPQPKSAHTWSHPAVYFAGKATDWYALATQPESQIYPRFERHYRRLCERVLRGESLELPMPQALENRASQVPDPEEQKRRLQALRDKLDL